MGGMSGALKAVKPNSFKDFIDMGRPGSKSDISKQKKLWNATWSPQPLSEGEKAAYLKASQGPQAESADDETLAEDARRRRLARRAPTGTVLTSSGSDESLGG